jgi:hypothetical protein
MSDRADARGWRTFVPSEPRTYVRGHVLLLQFASIAMLVLLHQPDFFAVLIRSELDLSPFLGPTIFQVIC